MWIALILGVIIVAIYYQWIKKTSQYLKDMPCPDGHPFLGSVLDLKKMSHRTNLLLQQWAKKLGGIYYFRVVGKPIVVVNSVDLIYEALVKKGKEFAGRIQSLRYSVIFGDMKGGVNDIGFCNPDKSWNLKRKIAHKSLKQFGEGMIRIQDLSLQFVGGLIDKFQTYQGQPFDPRKDVYHTVAGMIYTLVLGLEIKEGTQDMEDALRFEKGVEIAISVNAGCLLLDQFPFLRFLGNKCYKQAFEIRQLGDKFLQRLIHKRQNNPSGAARGVLDDLLQAQKEHGKDVITDEMIYFILRDLTIAGIGTTSPTLCSFLNILVANIHIQKKMQAEITTVLADRELPTLADRENMPYCRAAVLELLRLLTVTPFLLPHVTLCDTELNGYRIKKGTVVLMNVWAAHHNSTYWGEDPYVYKPERFLDSEGNLVPADHPCRKGLLAFGAGARSCLGEILAVNRIFLFVVSLLRNFDLLPDPDCKESMTFDPRTLEVVTIVIPKEFRIIAKPRH